jgi:hypothetical protein
VAIVDEPSDRAFGNVEHLRVLEASDISDEQGFPGFSRW